MRTVGVAGLWLVVALSAACGQQAPRQEASQAGFQAFWSDFRSAVLGGDRAKTLAMTAFPFKTRGPSDADPIISHDAASFSGLLDTLLTQDPGLKPEPETMRAFIERTPTVPTTTMGDGGQSARVGAFVFQWTSGRWKFTMAYTEDQ